MEAWRSELYYNEMLVELSHSGVKGQKWHRRLYQNRDGSLTPLGKLRRRQLYAAENRQKKKEAKEAEKKAKKEAKKKGAEEEPFDKDEAFRKGDIETIYKHRSEYTTQELKDAISRQEAMNSVRRLTSAETERGKKIMQFQKMGEFLNTAGDFTKSMVNAGEQLTKAYNLGVGIANSLMGTKYKKIELDKDFEKAKRERQKEIKLEKREDERYERQKNREDVADAREAERFERQKEQDRIKAEYEAAKEVRAEKKEERDQAKADREAEAHSFAKKSMEEMERTNKANKEQIDKMQKEMDDLLERLKKSGVT